MAGLDAEPVPRGARLEDVSTATSCTRVLNRGAARVRAPGVPPAEIMKARASPIAGGPSSRVLPARELDVGRIDGMSRVSDKSRTMKV